MNTDDAAAATLIILVGAWVISLVIFYAIIKAAVRNGIIEAGRVNGKHHYVYADIRQDRSAEFAAIPPVPGETPKPAPGDTGF